MLEKYNKAIILWLCLLVTSAFSVQKMDVNRDSAPTQPADERAAQENLPKAKDETWERLGKCKVTMSEDTKNDMYVYGINYTPEVKAMEGKDITITGFMLPLEASEKFKHFILSKRTPTCPFCPPGEPNEIIDVYTAQPVSWIESAIKIRGKFGFTKDQQLGMFFKMTNVTVAAPGSGFKGL